MTALTIAFVLFGIGLVQAMLLNAWRDVWNKGNEGASNEGVTLDGISVVVPARNADRTMVPLLQDLFAQDVPKERIEVIVVDDHSEDDTAGVVRAMMPRWPQLKLISAPEPGKKAAITAGVAASQYDIMVLTDADARCGSSRARMIAERMVAGGVDLLILPVRTIGERSFLGRLQEEEQAALAGMALGEAMLDRPGLAFGANLAFRKEAFHAVGGYTGDRFVSGDDVFLVDRMRKAGRTIAGYADPRALVTVEAEGTWAGFIRQRIRWAGKMRGMVSAMNVLGAMALLWPWLLVWRSVQSEMASLLEGQGVEVLFLLIAAWGLAIVPVVGLVRDVRSKSQQRSSALISVLCYLLFLVYAPVIAVVSLVHRPRWKGRRT